jgi:hypothetical protein
MSRSGIRTRIRRTREVGCEAGMLHIKQLQLQTIPDRPGRLAKKKPASIGEACRGRLGTSSCMKSAWVKHECRSGGCPL